VTVPLRAAEVDAYRRDGFLIRPEFFAAAEAQRWIAECDRLWDELSADLRNPRVQWRDRVGGGRVADRVDPVLDVSPAYRELAADPRLHGVAALLLDGTAGPFKAKLITKRPGTAGYGLHQDYPYWQHLGLSADDYVNVLVAFDRFDATAGATIGFPGLHRVRAPAPEAAPLDADDAYVAGRRGVMFELEPGGVVFFHSMLPHRSEPNRGERPRRGLFLTYVPERHAVGLEERYERSRLDKPH
jgi:ectoine hydroxylase-related dioxygenase (phytanoyl-CoA dioxygenase family)